MADFPGVRASPRRRPRRAPEAGLKKASFRWPLGLPLQDDVLDRTQSLRGRRATSRSGPAATAPQARLSQAVERRGHEGGLDQWSPPRRLAPDLRCDELVLEVRVVGLLEDLDQMWHDSDLSHLAGDEGPGPQDGATTLEQELLLESPAGPSVAKR